MTRRTLLRASVALATIPVLALGPATAPAETATPAGAGGRSKPNVLIVITDDQRVDEGAMAIMEQTLARLGDGGRRFRRAYASTPLCCPSRASILTGQYAHNHGVKDNRQAYKLDQQTTLEFNLKAAGYSTAIFGKFLNKWDGQPPYFDRWAIPIGSQSPQYSGQTWNVNGTEKTVHEYSTDWLGELTVDYLETMEADDGRPWFTLVTPLAPHAPSTPADRHSGAEVREFEGNPAVFEEDKGDKPPYVRQSEADLADAQDVARRQLRTLLAADDMIATIDDALGTLGERQNTLVFFIGDNGYTWGEHGLLGPGRSKNTPYSASIRIPLLMRWPARVPAGSNDGRFVANIDLAPTIYDAANLQGAVDHVVDGRSLLRTKWKRRWMFLERFNPGNNHYFPPWDSLRTKGWQYVETYGRGRDVTYREYYDHGSDPWQLRNLLHDDNPGNDPETSGLHAAIKRLHKCAGNSGPNACP